MDGYSRTSDVHNTGGDVSSFNAWPVYLYGMLRFGLSQELYAISTIFLGFSLLVILLMACYTGTGKDVYGNP